METEGGKVALRRASLFVSVRFLHSRHSPVPHPKLDILLYLGDSKIAAYCQAAMVNDEVLTHEVLGSNRGDASFLGCDTFRRLPDVELFLSNNHNPLKADGQTNAHSA